jgi:hypothetical protein
MFYFDFSLQVFRQPGSNPAKNNILPPVSIDENDSCYEEKKQGEQKPLQYFPESLQTQRFNL